MTGNPSGPRRTPASASTSSQRQVLPQRTPGGWRRWLPSWKAFLLTYAGVLVVLGGLGAAAWAAIDIPAGDPLASAQSSVLYYAGGKTELAQIGTHDSIHVTLNQISKPAQAAVLAAEDRNFYTEPGISFTGITRAVWVDLRGGDVQGGSTITQQLAKNLYLTQERTLSRKLREVVLAMKLDSQRSKASILDQYLNVIYFGHGTYGIEAASRYYFGIHASRLTAAQGAVLAALIRGPGYYDPTAPADRTAARARWQYVINGMVKDGALTQAQANALAYPVVHPHRVQSGASGPNGFVVQAVRDELRRNGFSDEQIDISGLRIYTTINEAAQQAAIKAEDDQFNPLVSTKGSNPPVSSLVSVRPGDGAVVAMYGGRDYGKSGCSTCFVNLATQASAQPGSSFKPYVLATAVNQNISIKTSVFAPYQIKVRNATVHNDSTSEQGTYSLVSAMAQSINTIFVPLAQQVGPKNVAATAHALGIPDNVPLEDHGDVSPLIALGVYPVHPIDQAVGFATLAAGGRAATPYLVTKVTDRGGHVLYDASRHITRALDSGVAADVTYAMQHVVSEGTATAAQLNGGRPAAGKTGTTQNNTNAWFVGFTAPGAGQLSTAVWVGHAGNVQPLTDVQGYQGGVYGGTLPAKIWKEFTDLAMAGKPVTQFPPPAYVGVPATTIGPSLSASPTPTPSATTASPTPSASATPSVTSPTPSGTPSPPTPSRSGRSVSPPPTTTTKAPGRPTGGAVTGAPGEATSRAP